MVHDIAVFLLQDQWLQSKIDHEVRMRDGTAKLLAASKQPAQLLEAARTLLTSNARMLAYMGELQRRKTDSLNSSRWVAANDVMSFISTLTLFCCCCVTLLLAETVLLLDVVFVQARWPES